MLILTGMVTGMEITSAEKDGDGERVERGRILVFWGRLVMGINFCPRAGLWLERV